MRVKILDAWARGIPIVSTTIGCEGIEVRDEENILIADTPQDFAQAVVRVIQDRELAQGLAENGRRWVEKRYDWRTTYGWFDAVYEQLWSRSFSPGVP
jgi:glycosyltransferase involved in cell wall biosynthesis